MAEIIKSSITGGCYGNENKKKRAERLFLAKQKGDHTKKEWLEIKSFFNVCVRCEGKSNLINIERDHIIPLFLGGSNSIKNIQPLCALCNVSKSDCIDYRIIYAKKHNLVLKTEWI